MRSKLGLLGKNIDYSFSRTYFSKKFSDENLNLSYENFDIEDIDKVQSVIGINNLLGFNVTIPYKQDIIPFLDQIDPEAKTIGAVNTVAITHEGLLVGYNTDCWGFKQSLLPLLKPIHRKALILGTGGAAKAIAHVLKQLGISYQYVSRKKTISNQLSYDELDEAIIKSHYLIINCTPLGTFPNTEKAPAIPYDYITENHIIYDLIYNPEKTKFLAHGESKGAKIINGYSMLVLQAEKAFEIWQKYM